MQKKKKEIGYDAAFPTRLRALMEQKGITYQELAEVTDVQRQAVGQWCLGRTVPDVLALGKIAEKYQVSADWLLGLSEITSPEMDLKAICQYTGLNEKSITYLHFLTNPDIEGSGLLRQIDCLLKDDEFLDSLVFFESAVKMNALWYSFEPCNRLASMKKIVSDESFSYDDREQARYLIAIMPPIESGLGTNQEDESFCGFTTDELGFNLSDIYRMRANIHLSNYLDTLSAKINARYRPDIFNPKRGKK